MKSAREEECRRKEAERKKQVEEQKLQEEQERKDRELRIIQEERRKIEEVLERKKITESKKQEEFEEIKNVEKSEQDYKKRDCERKATSDQKTKEEIKKKNHQEEKKAKKGVEKDLKQTINIEPSINSKKQEVSRPEVQKESLPTKNTNEMKLQEEKLKKLAEKMKNLDEESEITRMVTKPPTHNQIKTRVPKPVSEKVPLLKESQSVKSVKVSNDNDWTPKVVTVDSSSFMPQKNKKSEVQVLKIGSPSQIRKAVLCDVKVDKPLQKCAEEEVNGSENSQNYQITKIPTTIFEIKKPSPKIEQPKNYSITKA